MLTEPQKRLVLFGYLIVMASSLGFYSIYLDPSNKTSSLLTWVLPMLLGVGILGWKNWKLTGKLTGKKLLNMLAIDVVFILNFYLFSLWQSDFGLNFLVSGLVGSVIIIFAEKKL